MFKLFSETEEHYYQTRFSLFDYSACNEMSPRQCQAILDRRELFLTKPIVYQANSWKIVTPTQLQTQDGTSFNDGNPLYVAETCHTLT